jgi:hypothetical protein
MTQQQAIRETDEELDAKWNEQFPAGAYYLLCAPGDERAARWRKLNVIGWLGARPRANGDISSYIEAANTGPFIPHGFGGSARYFFKDRASFIKQVKDKLLKQEELDVFLAKVNHALTNRLADMMSRAETDAHTVAPPDGNCDAGVAVQ